MYHDVIHINFNNRGETPYFDYSFMISKYPSDKFSPINYGDLLNKFNEIGFNCKYIKFNDIDESETVYCTYNYQSNFNIFFSAYKKILQNKNFDIIFEYGVIINGKFLPNNMNTFAKVYFSDILISSHFALDPLFCETIIKGKTHEKIYEDYQVVNKEGNIIGNDRTDGKKKFEQHFFERYDIKVALRKYKLGRLKMFSEKND
jgi:hypothetical protein